MIQGRGQTELAYDLDIIRNTRRAIERMGKQ